MSEGLDWQSIRVGDFEGCPEDLHYNSRIFINFQLKIVLLSKKSLAVFSVTASVPIEIDRISIIYWTSSEVKLIHVYL